MSERGRAPSARVSERGRAPSARASERGRAPSARASERGRLFVALDLDDDARSALASWRDEIAAGESGLRPVADDALHVTLCFLGACALEDLDAIAAACAVDAGGPVVGLMLGGAGLWLPRRRPRVLAAGIEDSAGALARVQGPLAEALSAGGWYRPETRPFLGHVTVARVTTGERPREVPAPPSVALAATATVTIYRSHLSPRGARYEPVRAVRVDGGSQGAIAP
ncbi:MAG TPA: RNA 2',3'-cyclic phosphodiesterase [Solirubrobacteraceae bacterium]|nr:RNA 2',3'-cyclic phosphodiesterase [Solirubrobacteraceae bacterium]